MITLLVVAALIAALLVIAVSAEALFGVETVRWAAGNRLEQVRRNLTQAGEGVLGYLFSPGRSLWVYSPVLLAGFFGWPWLVRQRRLREIAVPLVMLASFVVGYALVRGEEWYGGTGWGPRYLVAVTPFLALWLLPVVERMLAPDASRAGRVALVALAIVSVGVQVVAVLVPVDSYYALLARQDPPIIPWQEGAWSVRWSPLWCRSTCSARSARSAGGAGDGAGVVLPALAVLLMALALGTLVWWLRRRSGTPQAFSDGGRAGAGDGVSPGRGTGAARHDPTLPGRFEPLRALLAGLEPQLRPDDVVVLSDNAYRGFFMNYYKQRAPMVLTLPYSPGKRTSPEAVPSVVSNDPDALIHPSNALILADLAQRHDRLWLITDSSPFVPWANRPVEQYLARHFFPVNEVSGGDLARAVLFDLTAAPPPSAATWPEQRLDAQFGAGLRLVGADLPAGRAMARGRNLPVSLLWEASGPIAQDYTVALLLIAPDGSVAAQRDSFPVNAFEPTSTWRAGSLHRDNHAIAISSGTPPGTYALWAVVYDWRTPDARLPVTNADGEVSDHALLAEIGGMTAVSG